MPRKLQFTDDALDDLDAVRRWLTQPGAGATAIRRLRDIRASIERLKQNPCVYPVLDHPGTRELPCPHGYRVFYELDPDTGRNDTAGDVTVLRVFGPGQDRNAS